jgi:hypothetical protein
VGSRLPFTAGDFQYCTTLDAQMLFCCFKQLSTNTLPPHSRRDDKSRYSPESAWNVQHLKAVACHKP